MRTLLIILLFVSGFAFAQPSINNPTPLQVCDDGNDGIETFNLFSKNAEVLGSLNASNHTVSYHETLVDAENNFNALPSVYNNIVNNQIIYVRVIENSSPTLYSTTTLTLEAVSYPLITPIPNETVCDTYILPALPFGQNYYTQPFGTGTLLAAGTAITTTQTIYIFAQTLTTPTCTSESSFTVTVNPSPSISQPSNLIEFDSDGTAVFNLTVQNGALLNGNPNLTVTYYNSLSNAESGTANFVNTTAYTNTSNPQTIYARVSDNVTGCYSITNFDLIVNTNPFPINNPTPLEVCDNNNDGIAVFNIDSKNAEILGSLSSSQYTVTYYENSFAAQIGGFGNILSPYFNVTPNNQTVYVRVELNSDTTVFSTTTLQLIVNPIPSINTPIPNLTVYENPTDGVAVFNLSLQNNYISNGIAGVNVTYYTTQLNALNQSNPIANPTAYVGNNNQVIWVNAQNTSGCSDVASFVLNVTNSSNIIIFTDSNFKAKLLTSSPSNQVAYSGSGFVKIDANNDNEIQFSEAAVIDSLDVRFANIIDVTGINGFSNLKRFDCSNNQIVTLNLTSINTLIDLFCSNNSITTLSINGLTNLQNLTCQSNDLSTINVSTNTNLRSLNVMNNSLTALNISNLTLLEYLDCRVNQLNSLNVNSNINLATLYCSYNSLTSLNVASLSSLQSLYCEYNQLTNLQFGANSTLSALTCGYNNLSALNTSTLTGLTELSCSNNQIASFDVSQNLNLHSFLCSNNTMTTLDCSLNTHLNTLSIISNPNLQTLFIKNGVNELNADSLLYCPSLTYICADDFQIPSIATSYPLITINSYCSFTPGGDYNTLTGTATFDINNNGCDASDIPFDLLGLNVSLNGVSTNSSVFTNNSGVYNLYTNVVGEYQLSPNFENPTYYNVSPIVQAFPVIDNSTATQNICITANGAHPDLEIIIAPITPARPGFNAQYQIVYKNKGNQTLSGSYTFNYDDSKLDFISATVIPNTFATGILTWNYSNLLPFENRTVYITLNVNSPVEIPAVNIGDIFTFSSTINPITSDETPSDNTFTYDQTVVGSYDPNDITCMEGETVAPSEIGEYLHYIVNFENTGNYYAENVVVKIEIDETKYDVHSLQLLNTSSDSKSKITNNVVEFIFEDINLAAASGNPPVGGHGNVLFKIKSKNNLVTGDMVQKAAKIYFDYNAPIVTNISQTTYQSLNNPIFEFDDSVKVYPNPTQSKININSNFNIKSVELYDVRGRILEKSFENNTSTTLNLSERQSGIYFVKITSDKGCKVEKVIKN